jgi:Macrocin-O-methyltransferase (TylF)
VKAIMRGVALRLPQIRQLYDFAMQQARENRERAATIEALTAEHAATAEEQDTLELQLYVLRSDHQRAAVRNQELSRAVDAAEDRALAAEKALDVRTREFNNAVRAAEDRALAAEKALDVRTQEFNNAVRAAEALAAERATTGVTPNDLSVLYAKLAGRMTLLSSEIERLQPGSTPGTASTTLYLDLLERALTGMLSQDGSASPWTKGYDAETRMIGRDWPSTAPTMIGLARMRNLRVLAERVVKEGIPGDMLEAGVWRGGACILMRGILAAHGITDRTVWVADSFAGLPAADPATYPADAGDPHATFDALRVPSEEVQANFGRFGLLDRQVRFLKGWFSETLPTAPIAQLSILRLDGDMYSSTIQTLDALYDKVVQGGYVIVDDYILSGCRQAVDDFRDRHGIHDKLNDVDGAAIFWRKS